MIPILNSIFFLKNAIRYISFLKILNFAGIVYSYFFSVLIPSKVIVTKPSFISIEPADFCQLECPECPVGLSKRKSGLKINLHHFMSVVDALKNELLHIIFYFQGEPLLNKDLSKMINYAHKAGIFTSTSTNAQILNNNNAKEIVLSGLDKLIVSVDGATQDVYERYRVGGQLSLTLEGIENINFWKKELKSRTPFVEIQFVVFKTNQHQMAEMKQLAKSLGVYRLSFKSAQLCDFENGNPLLTTIPRYARYKQLASGKFAIKSSLPNRCFRAWSGAVLTSKGDVLPCCFDKDSTHSYGNVSKDHFEAIYTGAKAQAFKQSLLANRRQHTICRNCTSK